MASEEIIAELETLHARGDKLLKATLPLTEHRALFEERVRTQQLDSSFSFETIDAGGVAAVWVTPPDVQSPFVYLFFHGGAYVKGCVAASHIALMGVCKALGARGLSVDYRVAPENPYPAALDDARLAYRYLLERGYESGRVVTGGSSAGGGLALALALSCRDHGEPAPAAVISVSPWADLTQSGDSMVSRANRDPLLTKAYLDRFAADYLAGTDPLLPTVSPVFADYTGLSCPTLVQVGSEEILFDDARRVVDKAKSAGLIAKLEVYDKGYHGWQNAGETMPEAIAAAQSAARFITEHLSDAPSVNPKADV